jgi:hypothetical protein
MEQTCPKCAKPYKRSGRPYEKHVEACDGTPTGKKGPRSLKGVPKPSQLEELIQDMRNRKEILIREKDNFAVRMRAIDEEVAVVDRCIEAIHGVVKEMREIVV